jgi:hypothetical protein
MKYRLSTLCAFLQVSRYRAHAPRPVPLRVVAGLVAAAALITSTQLYAHHSFAATYFEDKQETIEGDIAQFLFRNPHSFVQIEAKDEKGQVVRWAVEWGAGGQLGRTGVTRDTLKAGDHVVIVGNPGRNPEDHRLRMIRLKRSSDNFCWGCRPGETFD